MYFIKFVISKTFPFLCISYIINLISIYYNIITMGKVDNLLKEMFDLYIMIQIKGVPFAISAYRTRILEISNEILTHYSLPEEKGFENIFYALTGLIELPEGLIQSTRRKLEDSSQAYLAGRIEDYEHYMHYDPNLTLADIPLIQPDKYPRPIISDEVFGYVLDRLPFPLAEEEIVEIESGFVLRWNYSEGQLVGDMDFKRAVEHYLVSMNRFYDQKIVWKVVDLMLEYLEKIGQWKNPPSKPLHAVIDNSNRENTNQHVKKRTVVHFSMLLAVKHPDFMTSLSDCLMNNFIIYHFLPETKDIWCRDYMPVRVEENTFVQFIYDPDYLKNGWEQTKTDPWKVTMNLPIDLRRSDLVIDGGNVIRRGKTVIMTDKIYSENPSYKANKPLLLKKISETLEAEKVVIIPKEPGDIYGHSDGMVRFISDNTVIINDYLETDGYSKTFINKLKKVLQSHGLTIAGTLPYRSFPGPKGTDSAIGCYMNFLELETLIIFPKYNLPEDQPALAKIQEYFPNKKILPLNCTEIALKGGVLNCISWECKMNSKFA